MLEMTTLKKTFRGTKRFSTYLDFLPEEVQQYIWKLVYKQTLCKIKIFSSYKMYMEPVVKRELTDRLWSSYFPDLDNEPTLEKQLENDIYIDDNNVKKITQDSFTHLSVNLTFGEVNRGNTCGIFNDKIICNAEQMFFLIYPEF